MIVLKTPYDIENLRKSGKLVAQCLTMLKREAKPGVTTVYLDALAEGFALGFGARPAFKGYMGFPSSICTSVNSTIIHGIPSDTELKDGDILSIDYGIELNGYYGDSAITIPIGEVSEDIKKFIKTGQDSLYDGIKNAVVGNYLSSVSMAVQNRIEADGYGIVRQFGGHGIGKNLHEPPQVPNYTTSTHGSLYMKTGLVIAIEPMITQFSSAHYTENDNWTIKTQDGGLAVHWEHTIALTENGTEILTLREEEACMN